MARPINIFLDQNHWIYLARSYWGKPHISSHVVVSDTILSHILQRQVRLPLNLIHLVEHSRDESQERRHRLAEVFEKFCEGWYFSSWEDIISLEIRRALLLTFFSNETIEPFEIFGRGYLFATNSTKRGNWLPNWTNDEIEMLRADSAREGRLYELLTFPNEDGRSRQKKLTIELSEKNAAAAEDIRSKRRPYPKEVHRRAKYAEYTCDLQDQLETVLNELGKTFKGFLESGVEELAAFWQRVPSLDVDCELTLYRDRQWSKAVARNDVWDISHLALAVPYCGALVVERFWARAIEETGLAKKYGVAVFTDLSDLVEWLEAQGNSDPVSSSRL